MEHPASHLADLRDLHDMDLPDGSVVTMADGCVLTLHRTDPDGPCPTCGHEQWGTMLAWTIDDQPTAAVA